LGPYPPPSQAVDLVSYVEFQKNYRSLLEYHKAALEAARDFWRLVMRDTVPVGRARAGSRAGQGPVCGVFLQPHDRRGRVDLQASRCTTCF
jgi:hypothetical protein